ncbi:MAG: glycogen synthase GlgA [Deltaproteobacteria bacterium]|nr:glycogen synthase GlgA [Deltaproteobacteria bacterium]MBW1953346.1 glycogen synthase GlgA [Deltaproteobacteria bacterium]MBW1987320.1 glycogen synthase GlgA [Deltaproteobacteria bacterium]MBW2135069.1 glycogen synthase GlgA [Deltaproteobacteria bacterium]
MQIMIVAPEAKPFARNGGLAEVIHGLAWALVRQGHQVSVVTPYYRQTQDGGWPIAFSGKTLNIPLSIKTLTAEIYHIQVHPKLQIFFVGQDCLFNREGIYGTPYGDYEDNAERFIFLSRAVPEMIEALELDIDVCHCHEWHTGLIPAYLRNLYRDRSHLSSIATLYTVHNVGWQGIFPHYDLPLTGFGWEFFNSKTMEFYGKINLMKTGLVFADLINTVSETYRREILTPEYGAGLEGVFQERAQDLYGVLNGVDYETWDPSLDKLIASPFSRENLSGKKTCKTALAKYFGIELAEHQPMIGMTTRLTERKGIELVRDIMEELVNLNVAFVIQATGEERYQYFFTEFQQRNPHQVGVRIGYSEDLAHQIIAGSDMFLMPSRYEPCGLDQLYCLRYGTIPVVRATGGLDETIQDYDLPSGEGTGFKFQNYTAADLLVAIQRALSVYQDQSAWQKLIQQAMAQDFSWDKSVQKYLELYQKAMEKRSLYH